MRYMLRTILLASIFAMPTLAHAENDEIDVFFKTCMASAPSFSKVGDFSKPLGFQSNDGKTWARMNDGLGINIQDASDRRVCMIFKTGDHVASFKNEIEKVLKKKFAGAFEQKAYQGRILYLVRDMNENIIVEIVPPYGASTIVTANARKK